MIAAYIEKYGADQKLKIGEQPDPIPGPNDVLASQLSALPPTPSRHIATTHRLLPPTAESR